MLAFYMSVINEACCHDNARARNMKSALTSEHLLRVRSKLSKYLKASIYRLSYFVKRFYTFTEIILAVKLIFFFI